MIGIGSRVEILSDPRDPFERHTQHPHASPRFLLSNFVGCLGVVTQMDVARVLVALDAPHEQKPYWYHLDEIKEAP